MSVEFAVVLPVVALVLTSLVSAVLVVDGIGRLQLAASTAARAFGRGDDDGGRAAIERIAPGAAVTVQRGADVVCVEASRGGSGPFAAVPLRATGCAADGGR
ncbi:TadE family type IV pilus minor pilin [Curtobacterium sp. MCPF17_002]|uniref:TadE family type IV pilus minor pilin n=1 Tax=Curtobacterium sp. MCPF17_002 TaxID=2175645 RepID=UPI0015E8CF5E|nr:TadE family type IV pilus minor pilin [Curtobacterium sp. MCPF17_002]WIB76438.1 TadE family type IV pilus minor pilin [Curtobacterium sp. MCPF17_002]